MEEVSDLPYIRKAKDLVISYLQSNASPGASVVHYNDLRVVMCVWTTKNWQVILRTDKTLDILYKLSYDAEHKVTVLDRYGQLDGIDIPDEFTIDHKEKS